MRRYCQNMDITSPGLIERAIRKCLVGKWRRESVAILLSGFCNYTTQEIIKIIRERNRHEMNDALQNLSKWLSECFQKREITFKPVHQFTARDRSSGKLRDYCEECILQQFCNYIAVEALMPMFRAKIAPHQCASIEGRGQQYGQKLLEEWMHHDPKGTRDAIQADIRKAYPSTDVGRLKRMLRRDVKNPTLLWLVELLLDTMPKGLSIGSYLSMYLCNYMLSYAWRAAKLRIRRTVWAKNPKTGVYERKQKAPIARMLMYMDDLHLSGANKRDLLRAFWELCRFLRKRLGYRIKRSWRHYRPHFIDKRNRQRGSFTDMMGVRIYRNRTTLRRRVFLRTRRTYMKLERRTRGRRPIPKRLAGRAVSYNGWLIHTNSRKWMKQHAYKHGLIKRAKRTIAYYARKASGKNDTKSRVPVPA